ncbi:hypothetical protein O9H85_16785 [Paenibacillus filicis]|uniref:Uncharacterized protein n=1 Tax=Paenibacillus gyeongsangnamensis TaxID=3388067 RepID=A0ABT4QB65_9BACL|nr:hypothetical protein [Paenibacillus filicis]MCZ8514049.1 hypothetical protein [Paenibacillus filicis]
MFHPAQANFGFIKVNQLSKSTAIGFGSNVRIGVQAGIRLNQGFGQHYGDGCAVVGHKALIDDRDVIDAPSCSGLNRLGCFASEEPVS